MLDINLYIYMYVLSTHPVSKVESEDTRSESSDAVPLPSISVPLHSGLAPPPKASTPLQMDDLDASSRGLDDDHDDSALPLVAGNPESLRLETKLDAWCLDLKRNVLVSQTSLH